MSELTKQLLNYGIGGLFLLACVITIYSMFGYIKNIIAEHKKERDAWQGMISEQNVENKVILTNIKILLETLVNKIK